MCGPVDRYISESIVTALNPVKPHYSHDRVLRCDSSTVLRTQLTVAKHIRGSNSEIKLGSQHWNQRYVLK